MPRRKMAAARVADASVDATSAVRILPRRKMAAVRLADASVDATSGARILLRRRLVVPRMADAWAHATSPARISPRHYRARVPRAVPRLVDASAVKRLPLPKMAVDHLPMLLRPTIAWVEAMYAETAAGKAATGRNWRNHRHS